MNKKAPEANEYDDFTAINEKLDAIMSKINHLEQVELGNRTAQRQVNQQIMHALNKTK